MPFDKIGRINRKNHLEDTVSFKALWEVRRLEEGLLEFFTREASQVEWPFEEASLFSKVLNEEEADVLFVSNKLQVFLRDLEIEFFFKLLLIFECNDSMLKSYI